MIGIGEALSGISGSITETTLKKLGFADWFSEGAGTVAEWINKPSSYALGAITSNVCPKVKKGYNYCKDKLAEAGDAIKAGAKKFGRKCAEITRDCYDGAKNLAEKLYDGLTSLF